MTRKGKPGGKRGSSDTYHTSLEEAYELTPVTIVNREHWLTELAGRVAYIFKGFNLGKYRLTCGWPCKNAIGGKTIRLGECHAAASSKDKTFEIFISPLIDSALEVAGTACHELAHVAAGIEAGHGPRYKVVCKHVGLTQGKPVVAMPGPALQGRLVKVIEDLGDYPHSAIVPVRKLVHRAPSSVGLACEVCGCKVMISRKWLTDAGPPRCGCGGFMLEPE